MVIIKNITINIPDIYDKKIQELIKAKILPSRSEAVRLALREFLHNEYNMNLELLDYPIKENIKIEDHRDKNKKKRIK